MEFLDRVKRFLSVNIKRSSSFDQLPLADENLIEILKLPVRLIRARVLIRTILLGANDLR
jgi:hypothetical protein